MLIKRFLLFSCTMGSALIRHVINYYIIIRQRHIHVHHLHALDKVRHNDQRHRVMARKFELVHM